MSTSTEINKAKKEPFCHGPSYQAYQLLRIAFTVVPLIAGLDKFFYFLTTWEQFLSPTFNLIGKAHTTMIVVGIIEIIVAIGMWFKPKCFAYIFAIWLFLILVNLLLLGPGFYDILLRDLGLLLSVLALGRLSSIYDCGASCQRKSS